MKYIVSLVLLGVACADVISPPEPKKDAVPQFNKEKRQYLNNVPLLNNAAAARYPYYPQVRPLPYPLPRPYPVHLQPYLQPAQETALNPADPEAPVLVRNTDNFKHVKVLPNNAQTNKLIGNLQTRPLLHYANVENDA